MDEIFTKNFKMVSASKTEAGSNITMGNDIKQTKEGTTAAEAVNLVVSDVGLCDLLQPGASYSITIKKVL